ncbi:hypothetical protein HYS94_02470 [Candidatus Daviesbacteria bacterium]|nr:hypothetical protein [Candidatus Daviesbacteria bacterium]
MQLKLLAIGIILMGIFSRLVPHAPNIAAIGALMLFGGVYLPKKIFWLPILALFITDFFIGFYGTDMIYVYGSYLLVGLIGLWLRKHKKPLIVLGSALTSSVLFFLITNFGVWAPPNNWYPHTLDGLLTSYTMALPFFRNSLIGDLGYTVLLFGGYEIIQYLSKKYLPRKLFQLLY